MFAKLFVFLCLLYLVNASGFKLNVDSHGSRSEQLLREGQFSEFRQHRELLRRSHRGPLANSVRTRASRLVASQPLVIDNAYTVNVTIGTPPQQFTVLFDSFYPSSWIYDISCVETECAKFTRFDGSKSSTYVKDGRTAGSGEFIYGFLGRDSYGLTDQLIVKNFTFDQVNTTINVLFDGALGLGLGSEDNGETSSLQAAYDQGLIDKPIFTLYLARNDLWDPDTKGQVAGQLTYGSLDTDHCSSEVIYVTDIDKQKWDIGVTSLQVNNKPATTGTWSALVDQGDSEIIFPHKIFLNVVQALGATFDNDVGLYSIACDTKFTINFQIDGGVLQIDEKLSLFKLIDKCILRFDGFDGFGYDYFFGRPITDKYCQIYDLTGKIGFAAVTV